MKKVAIIGGGITGLVAALRLSQNGLQVELFEKEENLGGLARMFEYKVHQIPLLHHQFFEQDTNILSLVKEFNLTPFLASSTSGIFSPYDKNLKTYPLKKPKDIFTFSLLSLKDRIKLGLFALNLKLDKIRNKNYDYLKEVDAKTWLIQKTNEKIYSSFFEPLFFNKFATPLEEISAEWFATLLRDTVNAFGKLAYIDEGMKLLMDKIKIELIKNHCVIHTSCEVLKIEQKNNKITSLRYRDIINKKEKKIKVDAVLSTIATPVFLRIVPQLPQNYKKKLSKIEYSSYVGGILIRKEPLTKGHITYFLRSDIGGVNEFTNFYPKLPFKIIYIFKYLKKREGFWNKSEKEIKEIFIDTIKKAYPALKYDDLFIFKEAFASPIFKKDFSKHVPDIKTPVKGLFIAGMFTCYPLIRNLDSGVLIAERAAKIILKEKNKEK